MGNHSSPSQFSNEGWLLCFSPSSFKTALHLSSFPRCGAVGLFGKSQSTLWKDEVSTTLVSMVPVLLDPQHQSPVMSRVKDVILVYRQLKTRCLHRVSWQVASSCFSWIPLQSLCKPAEQEDTSKHSKISIDGQLQYCLLPDKNVNLGEWMLKNLSGACVPSHVYLSSFTPVPWRQPEGPRWSAELLTSGSS